MNDKKKFLVDVGMRDLPFPMKVISRADPEGQPTVAHISINAHIMQAFEAGWIDTFIQIVHQHRDRIGTQTLKGTILDYIEALHAATVKIDFAYPFFVEKTTPVSGEKCLVRYLCTYSVKASSIEDSPKVIFKIEIPCITTYPTSDPVHPGGLFGQLSLLTLEVESRKDIYPEDLVELVDKHALAPVYSFLTEEDQRFIIHKIHSEKQTSVVMTDGIKGELARNSDIDWYAIRCSNFGMLHSYSTVIGTEKSSWVPSSGHEEMEI